LLVEQILKAYEVERRPIVISYDRMARAIRKLAPIVGAIDADNRPSIASAVRRYVDERCAEGVRVATIRRELIVLRAALRLAWKQGLIAAQPYIPVPPASLPQTRWLTPAEAKRLIRACEAGVYTFVLIALTTGARRGAILELTWDRVDFVRGTIDFRAPHPKAARRKRRAIVPMAPILHKQLQRDRTGAESDRVVPMSASQVERRLKKAAANAALDQVTAHSLRHTAATWLLGEAKLQLPVVSAMLGHKSSLITEQVYAHLSPDHLTPAAIALDRIITETR